MNWIFNLYKRSIQLFKRRPRGTVRTTFSLSILGLLLSASIIGVDVSYLKLETNDPLVRQGERFSVDLVAVSHTPVNAVDITIAFDGDRLDVASVDRGQSVLTIWTEDPIINKNSIVFRGGTFRRGFLGEHLIATVEFVSNRTGSTDVAVSDAMFLAGDGSGTPVPVADSDFTSATVFAFDENTDLGAARLSVTGDVKTDLDLDGSVSLVDLSAFMGAWSSRTRIYDFDGDGRMSFRDFSILLADVLTR